MHSNTSQTGRAIALYALTGCFDAPGGNVPMSTVPVGAIFGRELLPPAMHGKSLGHEARPLGPESIFGWITTDALYKAVLEREPYGVDALGSFGLHLLVSHADGARGAQALDALDFMVHADLFMTPTAAHADIFLPVNTPWERAALKTGFAVDQRACAHVQLRQRVIEPRGESRSDAEIAFALAQRLGLGDVFWSGDIEAAYAAILAPSGVSLAELRAHPAGKTLPLKTRYRKHAGDGTGPSPGFATPSRKVELYSETLLAHGYDPARVRGARDRTGFAAGSGHRFSAGLDRQQEQSLHPQPVPPRGRVAAARATAARGHASRGGGRAVSAKATGCTSRRPMPG